MNKQKKDSKGLQNLWKPLFQAFFSTIVQERAFCFCIKISRNIDPACGSGSLLLKFAKILGKDKVRQGFFGQEINITTYNLCRINMFLHDIDYDKFDIGHGNTLTDPIHWDEEPFEAIVSNPPYSKPWEGDSNPILINDPRFASAGVLAPQSKSDFAFIMHSLHWLAPNGVAAIVVFPGVLYRSNSEMKIRKYLVENNYVDAVIQLPPNLFFGTPISTCILVLSKSKKDNKVLFVDASKEFSKVGNKNKLTEDNVNNILQQYVNRVSIQNVSELVSFDNLKDSDFNLSVSTYLEKNEDGEVIDIARLNAEIEVIVAREQVLRDEIAKIISEIEVK